MKHQDPKSVQTVSTEPSDADFIKWLEETLIPDLFESEQNSLIEDFQRLIEMVRNRNDRLTRIGEILGDYLNGT